MSDPWPPLDISQPKPHIDLLKIALPTDNLTIKDIRRRFPVIDAGKLRNFEELSYPECCRWNATLPRPLSMPYWEDERYRCREKKRKCSQRFIFATAWPAALITPSN